MILQRYSLSIFRYLRAAVKDEEAAHDLYQEFALRFIRGDYAAADPSRGRFRHFLKRILFNLATDHWRECKRRGKENALAAEQADAVQEADHAAADAEFAEVWKSGLLARAWAALEAWEQTHGQQYYRVLLCRAEHPEADSTQLAVLLSETLAKPVNAGWVRNRLHFARETFAGLLVEEVRQTLVQPSQEDVIEELMELGLWERCKGALSNEPNSAGPQSSTT